MMGGTGASGWDLLKSRWDFLKSRWGLLKGRWEVLKSGGHLLKSGWCLRVCCNSCNFFFRCKCAEQKNRQVV